jgi:hypothetical protein
MNKIKLINGPLDGKLMPDSGAKVLRYSLPLRKGENLVRHAIYEPNDRRTLAFWEGNEIKGKNPETIPA